MENAPTIRKEKTPRKESPLERGRKLAILLSTVLTIGAAEMKQASAQETTHVPTITNIEEDEGDTLLQDAKNKVESLGGAIKSAHERIERQLAEMRALDEEDRKAAEALGPEALEAYDTSKKLQAISIAAQMRLEKLEENPEIANTPEVLQLREAVAIQKKAADDAFSKYIAFENKAYLEKQGK